MAEARTRDEWARISALMSLIANCHRDPKKTRALRPADFDPFANRAPPPKVGVEVLREVFIEGKVPAQGGAT